MSHVCVAVRVLASLCVRACMCLWGVRVGWSLSLCVCVITTHCLICFMQKKHDVAKDAADRIQLMQTTRPAQSEKMGQSNQFQSHLICAVKAAWPRQITT